MTVCLPLRNIINYSINERSWIKSYLDVNEGLLTDVSSMVRSSLQIRGHVRRAGAIEELHIKKTDKLSAIKTNFR